MKSKLLDFAIAALLVTTAFAQDAPRATVKTLKVTILSTMLADEGLGEWGFSALVESDGHRILVDTGAHPNTVLSNARDLGIDLSDVQEVILTHNHNDHTGGLMTLRRELMQKNPSALSIAHVGRGIFYSRPGKDGKENNSMLATRKDYEATDGNSSSTMAGSSFFPEPGSPARSRASSRKRTGPEQGRCYRPMDSSKTIFLKTPRSSSTPVAASSSSPDAVTPAS